MIKANRTEFAQKLVSLGLIKENNNNNTENSLIDSILNSRPNLNYLYSNYSQTYYEPLSMLFGDATSLQHAIVNAFYGPSLDLIDFNRPDNKVFDSQWIKSTMCSATNDVNEIYLLQGPDQHELKEYLCNKLTDSQLTALFVYVSEQIDYSLVKEKVNFNLKCYSLLFID